MGLTKLDVGSPGGGITGFTYDSDGNVTGETGATTWILGWTMFNMPASISYGTKAISFQYDADHNRVTETAANSSGSTMQMIHFAPTLCHDQTAGEGDVSDGNVGQGRIPNTAFRKRGKLDVIKWDVIKIVNGAIIRITFEEVNSPWRQGVWLKTDCGISAQGEQCPSVVLWQDTAPMQVDCTCLTGDGYLSVYNVWDSRGGKGRQSQAWSSGMIIEDIPNGRRYRCNDIGFKTNFDKIVFRIEVLN